MRKTKIICTLGPACDSDETVRKLMLGGMNVERFNFSHGSYEEHKERIDRVKRIRAELDLPIATLLDTKGPEIRTGSFEGGKTNLVEGETVIIRNEDIEGNDKEFSISYKELHKDVVPDSRILIDDGLIELKVTEIKGKDIVCKVQNGGQVSTKKSINVPNSELRLPALTQKDIEDIEFGIKNDIDFIAASFVRKPQDVIEIRRILEKNNAPDINIIAKIENGEGVANFEDILKVADGIMVARGDLGVEIPAAVVPVVQKKFIQQCYSAGKISITATQMLDSMIRNPRPTRAEVSDVANAIFDGTSAVMLSGETASGKYPVESLQMMVEIASKTEGSIDYWNNLRNSRPTMVTSVANAISHATCTTAMDLNAKAIIAITLAGKTARQISRFRPECPIIATAVIPRVQRQLNLCWGVWPTLVKEVQTSEELFDLCLETAASSGFLSDGDLVVMTGGTPVGMSGTTNTIRVHSIGHAVVHGKGLKGEVSPGKVKGSVLIISDPEHLPECRISPSDDVILVAPYTNNAMMPFIRRAKALVVENDDALSHTATVAMALDIPTVIACENAVRLLKEGWSVTVDAEQGSVSL